MVDFSRKNQLIFSPGIMPFQRRNNSLAHKNVFQTWEILRKYVVPILKPPQLSGPVSRKYVPLLQLSIYFTGYFLS